MHGYEIYQLRAGTLPMLPQGYDADGTQSFSSQPKITLHYGDPLIVREEILFHGEIFNKFEKKGSIAIRFGGKKSPQKLSTYIFDFDNAQINEIAPDDLVHPGFQNRFMLQVDAERNFTKEDIITRFGAII